MMDILNKIVEAKKIRVSELKKIKPIEEIKKQAQTIKTVSKFYTTIKRLSHEPIKLIAEIKKASPIRGLLKEYDVLKMADLYISSGADAISVITEEDFFLGSPEFLTKIKEKYPHVPVLRKDFIFDEYQIYESKMLKADAILLIACILSKQQCKNLYEVANSLQMDVLFEVHDEEDLEKAFFAGVEIIGINNRNLKTMEIDLNITLKLKKLISDDKVTVSESGISERAHVERLLKNGIDAILVGTSIVLSDNPEKKIKELKLQP